MTGWLIGLALCHILDAGTTIAMTQRGGVELNPLLPRRPSIVFTITLRGGAFASQAVALRHVNEKHPKMARGLAVAASGVACGAGVWNAGQLMRRNDGKR